MAVGLVLLLERSGAPGRCMNGAFSPQSPQTSHPCPVLRARSDEVHVVQTAQCMNWSRVFPAPHHASAPP